MAIVETAIKLWNGWEMRVLVLLSLSLQVILIAFGSKRKSTTSTWINFIVWSAYLSADWVATVALGILARSLGSNAPNQNHSLQSFWAPFLLLHLGGPDTITAYSLEDNELWLRHFVGLVFEIGVAIYVLLRSWVDGDTTFSCIAIPVFIAGIIKYGERTYVLMSSSTKQFRTSSLDNLLRLYEDSGAEMFRADSFLLRVDSLFKRLKFLFADLLLDQNQRYLCNKLIRELEPRVAFEVVEYELGLLYDLLYTKARLVYSCFGIFFRCITCLASVSALVTFSIIIDEHEYSPVDRFVTYLLLVGAVVLEVYALLMLTSSDWLKLWLVVQKKCHLKRVRKGRRWSRSIAKCNLVSFCLQKEATKWIIVKKLLGIYEMLEKHQNVEWQQGIDDDLKCLIFHQLDRRTKELEDFDNTELSSKVLNYRGECVLNEMKLLDELKWSTVDVEFDESILLWHIATQLCYYDDIKTTDLYSLINEYSKISRCLSEYMLYLFVLRSKMLPKGIGEIRYRKACEEVFDFFKEKRDIQIEKAYQELLEGGPKLEELRSDESSILLKGRDLAKQLQNLNKRNRGRKEKWEMMNKVWVELLTYAAGHCGWKEHGRQLAKGGQLLTHVCLLMAHFGISGQYRDGQLSLRQLPKKKLLTWWERIKISHHRQP
ncbi:PREDICTED: uncharacterized protein LOC108662403 [Theobroma cacao]|uniref:Uncharacterized protein LOC108662403 n=1 Tax=Theobroma cacao TaxID=3641 RepID=A0AB32WKZ9_THECC|nr:PREDICTED: uncharacterized protein LOC108662403 [Theobroma cacao]